MILKAESVRYGPSYNITRLFSDEELAAEFPVLSEADRNDLQKTALEKLGTHLGYRLDRQAFSARYRRWAEVMELPEPVVNLPKLLIIQLHYFLDKSIPGRTIRVRSSYYFLDIYPPPARLVADAEVPVLADEGTRVELPVEIQGSHAPLSARDGRTSVIKNGLLLLMKTLAAKQDDPLAPAYQWEAAVATARRLVA